MFNLKIFNNTTKKTLWLIVVLMLFFTADFWVFAEDEEWKMKDNNDYNGTDLSYERPSFSDEEIEFIEGCGVVTVAHIPDNQPGAYLNANGEMTGIIVDFMEEVSKISGIKFKHVFIPDNEAPIVFLRENPDCIAGSVLSDNPAFESDDILLTKSYYSTSSAIAIRTERAKGIDIRNGNYSIGTSVAFQAIQLYIANNYPNLDLKADYTTISEGLEALADGKIDMFAYDLNVMMPYLGNPRFGGISIIENHFMVNQQCAAAMSNERNKMLMGIIDKSLSVIPQEVVDRIEKEHLRANVYHYNQSDMLYKYKNTLLLIGFIVALAFAALVTFNMIRQRKYTKQISHQAERDMMTGVYNRTTAKDKVQRYLSVNGGKPCTLLMIDIDDLKGINDEKGHAAGDEAIKGMANILKTQFRDSDIVGRIGGDEFIVFLGGVATKETLIPILERMLKAVGEVPIAGGASYLSCSVGAAMGVAGNIDPEKLYHYADEALYKSKKSGKNRYSFYEPNRESIGESEEVIESSRNEEAEKRERGDMASFIKNAEDVHADGRGEMTDNCGDVADGYDDLYDAVGKEPCDDLTGGLTRSGFIHSIERMHNNGVDLTQYALLFINIKDFKAINEMVGYSGGDSIMRTVFKSVRSSFLNPVISARNESDHFVFLVEKSSLELSKLQELLSFDCKYDGKDLFIHCRCGIFNIDDANLEVYKMIDRAKLAKEHIVDDYIKPYVVYDSSMMEEYSERAAAFFLFDEGLKNNEFHVFYQPVIDAKTEKIVSAEALVRRITANGTIVYPGKFLPILERTGYISMLDRFVALEVRSFLYKRKNAGLPVIPVAFNLSQKDFYDASFMELLAECLETSTLPEGSIMLEITESAYTLNEKENEVYLKRLRASGGKILLDDFGTGYSSFGMFENYNFDRVKLDMSFVRQLEDNENVRKVVHHVIAMCHDLGIQVVAEGVETEGELAILRDMDCDFIQGYYYSKPLDEKSFVEYISEHI